MDMLRDLMVVDAFLRGGDVEPNAAAAWQRLRPALMAGGLNPPGARGAAWRGLAGAANQLYRMDLEGRVAAPDSVGLERLLLRWVQAAEGMTQLLTVIWEGADQRRAAAAWQAGKGAGENGGGWDEHQVSYCDDCGAELPPDGCCVVCEHREGRL